MHAITPPPSTWWSRNWKWCVPVLAALLLALFAAFVFGILMLVFGAMTSSEPYRHAMTQAQTDPAVTAALGTPIQAGWLVPTCPFRWTARRPTARCSSWRRSTPASGATKYWP